jgi:outer membrane protein OmpA-like peptidoglycan-associated protein
LQQHGSRAATTARFAEWCPVPDTTDPSPTTTLRDRASFLYEGDRWWVGSSHQLSDDDLALRVPASQAAALLIRWSDDSFIWPRLVAAYEDLCGPLHRAPSAHQARYHMEPALRAAFERGDIVALRDPRKRIVLAHMPEPPPPAPGPKPRPAPRDKHYLDVTLQDDKGVPLAGKRYKLQLPDASTEEGVVDGSGRIYRPDVPEGTAWLWILPNKGDPVAAEDIEPPAPAPTDTQTFTVKLVDELGTPVSGVPFAMQHSGATDTVNSGDDGQAQVADDAAQVTTASFADANALREALRDRWNAPRDGDALQDSDDVTVVELHGDTLPSVDLAPGVTQTISVQPYVERGRLLGGYFDTSKSFLLPTGMDGVRAIVAMYGDNDGAALLVVGHTDTAGTPDYNDPLSLERANALKDFLTQNVDGWLPWYGSTQPDEKRWGTGEDEAMIGALPDAGGRDDSESPVAWYRRTRGMSPGEKPDKPMRQQLIGEYMALEGTSLPDGISVVTHGCGENFPADPTPDGVADPDNRRVEVFFFDGVLGVQPPPPGDNSEPGSTEYPEWVKRARRTASYIPGDRRYHFLYGLPWGPDAPWSESATLRIISVDGTQRCDFAKIDGESVNDYLVFTFVDSLPGVLYRGLIVDDTSEIPLFGPVELWRLQDPSDPYSDLPLPEITTDDSDSSADEADMPLNDTIGDDPPVDPEALAVVASGGPTEAVT